MKKRITRLFSALLSLVMVLGMIPVLMTDASAKGHSSYTSAPGYSMESFHDVKTVLVGDSVTYKVQQSDDLLLRTSISAGISSGFERATLEKVDENTVEITFNKPGKVETFTSTQGMTYTCTYYTEYTVVDKQVDDIYFTFQAPEIGAKIPAAVDYGCYNSNQIATVTEEQENGTYRALTWTANRETVSDGKPFELGKNYRFKLTFKCQEGYALGDAKVYVNGEECTAWRCSNENEEYFQVSYYYPTLTEPCESDVAVVLAEASAENEPEEATCDAKGIELVTRWYDENQNYFAGQFEAGGLYTAQIFLKPKTGYTLPDDWTVSLNGKEAVLYRNVDGVYGSSIFPYYDKTLAEQGYTHYIWRSDIAAYDEAKYAPRFSNVQYSRTVSEGGVAYFRATVENPLPSKGYTVGWNAYEDGKYLSWSDYEKRFGSTVTEIDEDCIVISNISAEAADVEYYCQVFNDLGLNYQWFKINIEQPKSSIEAVDITNLDAPTHGKAGDYTATTSTAGCTVSGVQYTMFNKILDPYVGVKGDNLAIKVTVKAGSGYEFAENVKATWNGIDSYSATVNAAGDECTFIFTCTVGEEDSAVIKALSMIVDAPVIGKAPATTATVGAGTRLESLTWEPADATFQESVSYTVKGYIWADDAHLFMDDIVTNGTAIVNGQAATMSKPATSGGAKQKFATGVYVSYTFPALNPDAPVITAQPKDVSVKAGGTATFTVAADGEDLHYQWWMVDAGVPTKVGTDSATLTLTNLDQGWNQFQFWCVVSNSHGEATSNMAQLTVSASGQKSAFTDVPETAYYNQPVAWAVEKGITNGTTATTFSPNATCTRAQIITFLWRAAGSPEPKSACSFTDIPAGSYFEKAVTWAAEQGMVGGDKFGPNDPCTRQMAVEFMWRQAGSPKAPAAGFTDVSSEAVNWALEEGVTTGTTETTFSPGSTCTRAQIVTFLWRAFGA